MSFYSRVLQTLAQAREMVKESVAIYNHERPHLALKYKTPDDVHQAFYRQKKCQRISGLVM